MQDKVPELMYTYANMLTQELRIFFQNLLYFLVQIVKIFYSFSRFLKSFTHIATYMLHDVSSYPADFFLKYHISYLNILNQKIKDSDFSSLIIESTD